MSRPTNPKPSNSRGKSVIRKAQIIAALVGALYAVGIHIYCSINPPRFADLPALLLDLAQEPAILISQAIGLNLENASGNLAFFPLCISVVVTSVLFSFLGTCIGAAIRNRISNKM